MTGIYKGTIRILMILIMLYLSIQSFFHHIHMDLDGVQEKSICMNNSILYMILGTICFALLFWLFQRKKDVFPTKKAITLFLGIEFIACLGWMIIANTREGADQAQVLYAAQSFAKGEFGKLAHDQYMGMFPYQLPLALFYEPFYILFGEVTPIIQQLLNVFWICGIQYLVFKIYKRFASNEKLDAIVLGMELLNFPLILYVSFIYGTIIGAFFSLLAIELFFEWEENEKLFRMICSALCMGIACLLRTNYLIFFIALSIIVILSCIERKQIKYLALIACTLLFYLGGKFGVTAIYEARSGMEIGKGQPMSLNIATGLSENEERAAGWFNGYTWTTYIESGYSYEKSDKFAKEKIAESIGNYFGNPLRGMNFLNEKLQSTWINPDFQGLWNNEHHGQMIARAPIISTLYYGKLHILSENIFILFVFLIYFGTFLFFLLDTKDMQWRMYTLALMFLGGFFFHLFWETKAQYVIIYYTILFPYAALGWNKLLHRFKVKK